MAAVNIGIPSVPKRDEPIPDFSFMEPHLRPKNFCDGKNAGLDFGVRPGEMMSVRITAFCSERCGFCIASEDMKTKLPANVERIIQQVRARKPKSLNTIGGEPFLFLERCIQLNDGVADIVSDNWYTTSLPKTLVTQWDLFEKFMENPIVKLMISIQDMDWENNNRLMESRNNFDRIEVLEKILYKWGDRVQVNLNLIKGGVDSYEKLMGALMHLESIGAKRVRLNELQKAPEYYVNFESISGVELESPYAHGCKTNLDDFYPGLSIQLKRSCFMVEKSLGASVEDVEKLEFRMAHPEHYEWADAGTIYEDGNPSFYWKEFRSLESSC